MASAMAYVGLPLESLLVVFAAPWQSYEPLLRRGARSSGWKVAGTPPAPFWDLLVGACVQSSALFDKSWAAAPHEIGRLLFVPRLKLLLVDGDFERSFKRKEASREGPSFCKLRGAVGNCLLNSPHKLSLGKCTVAVATSRRVVHNCSALCPSQHEQRGFTWSAAAAAIHACWRLERART